MVSFGPDVQTTNYTHMYELVEPRNCLDRYTQYRNVEKINENSLYGFLYRNNTFSKFKSIVDKAGMAGRLNNIEANYTLFAVPDSHLNHIPEEFFQKMDNGEARQIIDASIMDRKIDRYLITSSPVAYYFTKNPNMRMYVTNIRSITRLNDCVDILKYDISADNGIIHIISGLIIPSSDHFLN